ncbi:MAG TPA: HipA family kinase [Terracidiphilus sp.]|jgi:hypothetical protein
MAVTATQHIRRMRGGAQGQLMLGADGHLYVVKFRNNPQHTRVLANELLAARLALAAGLTVPEPEIVEVSQWLVDNTSELEMDYGRRREPCSGGLNFGSRYVGGLMPGQVVDFLPEDALAEVRNVNEFAGILALDKWTGNANGRQAVFARRQRERRYRAWFIDFGYCFHAGDWKFDDIPLRGVYYRNSAYSAVTGFDSFEPWLTRLEQLSPDAIWQQAADIPPNWYGEDIATLEALVEKLIYRRRRIRELIDDFRRSDRQPFPNWGMAREQMGAEVWPARQIGATIPERVN